MYAILFFLDALVLSKFILRWVTSSFWVTQMFILDAFNRWQNLISASHKTLFFLPNLIIEDKTSSSFWRIRFLASWKWCYQCDQDAAVFLEQNPVSYSSVGPAVVEEMDGDAVICQCRRTGGSEVIPRPNANRVLGSGQACMTPNRTIMHWNKLLQNSVRQLEDGHLTASVRQFGYEVFNPPQAPERNIVLLSHMGRSEIWVCTIVEWKQQKKTVTLGRISKKQKIDLEGQEVVHWIRTAIW